jgi:hypothetical protein
MLVQGLRCAQAASRKSSLIRTRDDLQPAQEGGTELLRILSRSHVNIPRRPAASAKPACRNSVASSLVCIIHGLHPRRTHLSPSSPSLRPPPKSSTMAKKQAAPPTPAKQAQSTPAKQSTPAPSTPAPVVKASTLSPRSSPQEIVLHVWDKYIQDTPSRTLFLDVFLLYLVLNGAVQFVYCVIGGNYVRSHATPLATPMSPIGAA